MHVSLVYFPFPITIHLRKCFPSKAFGVINLKFQPFNFASNRQKLIPDNKSTRRT